MLAAAPVATVAGTALALSGCSGWGCTDTTAERGTAGARVQVVNPDGRPLGVTAAVVDWRLQPHPQVPAEGDRVHFRFRFENADRYSPPAVDACAVDRARVVLGCETVSSSQANGPAEDPHTGDAWIAVERPRQVAEVLFVPNDQSYDRRTCDVDVKDGGGMHPPEHPDTGDRL
ncbi:hypothetical protein [Streptomyces sp. NPDC089919]|uniref:hypothetical protein n=1 Tax=Streptomyces sp. NPDC089919 TaxID=3155188 RepID=UPI00342579FF